MTNIWPCWITEPHHCQTLNCFQHNCLWDVDLEMSCPRWKVCFNQQVTTRKKSLSIFEYLRKTKEEQKKYHDRHASENMKEFELGTKVRMQPWTDSKEWKPATVVRHRHTPRSYVVQAEDGRKYRRNRQHLRVCPASGHGSLDAGPSLASRADQAATQD